MGVLAVAGRWGKVMGHFGGLGLRFGRVLRRGER